MPKNSVADWDTTAGNNTDIGGINIDEGCAMANLNNGMREMMAQIKTLNPVGSAAAAAAYQPLDADLTALAATGVSAFSGLLYGLTLSNNGSDATNDIDIAVGVAIDSTNAKFIKLTGALTKRLDAAWAVGTNQGGLDTGAIANTTYHMWLIMRSDTGVVDVLFSTSASSPTMPANYDYKRRIGSIVRTGGAIKGFVQIGDEFFWKVQAADIAASNPGTSAVTATLTVPIGIVVTAAVSASLQSDNISAATFMLVTALTLTDTAPSSSAFSTVSGGDSAIDFWYGATIMHVQTNTSGQVRYRLSDSSASFTARLQTVGWIDTRGRLA